MSIGDDELRMIRRRRKMANENETLADIIAYLRSIPVADPISAICGPIVHALADRLEAAWKREAAEIEVNAAPIPAVLVTKKTENVNSGSAVYTGENKGGNAAALREALVRVRGWLERMNKERLDAFAESQITPAYAVNRQAKTIIEDNEYHIGQINSALSAPPRNCDRPECATIDGMVSAHEEFCESWHEAGNSCAGCPYNKQSRRMTCREVWLIAPAEEGADE